LLSTLRKQRDTERLERTRSRLLDSATSVFSRKGYHNTLVSDVVAEAGVGQGTFYRHFQGKREVLDALFERLVEDLFAEFRPMSSRLPSSTEEYRQASIDLLSRMAGIAQRNRQLLLLLMREGPSVDQVFSDKLAGIYDRFAAMARYYLEHGIRVGFARPCRADWVAQAVVGMGLRMVSLWLAGGLAVEAIEEVVRETVDFAFLGLGSGTAPNQEDSNG
jgi:AcrR family transcriptional regulator